jgi:hypothetical protein
MKFSYDVSSSCKLIFNLVSINYHPPTYPCMSGTSIWKLTIRFSKLNFIGISGISHERLRKKWAKCENLQNKQPQMIPEHNPEVSVVCTISSLFSFNISSLVLCAQTC